VDSRSKSRPRLPFRNRPRLCTAFAVVRILGEDEGNLARNRPLVEQTGSWGYPRSLAAFSLPIKGRARQRPSAGQARQRRLVIRRGRNRQARRCDLHSPQRRPQSKGRIRPLIGSLTSSSRLLRGATAAAGDIRRHPRRPAHSAARRRGDGLDGGAPGVVPRPTSSVCFSSTIASSTSQRALQRVIEVRDR
jgi:hypothetical protein